MYKEKLTKFLENREWINLEIEARFLNIDEYTYNKILNIISSKENIKSNKENTKITIYKDSDIRKVENIDNGNTYYEEKKPLYKDFHQNIKFNVSREIKKQLTEEDLIVKQLRERNRTKFYLYDLIIDFTIIKNLDITDFNIIDYKYEIEIEKNNDNKNLNTFFNFIEFINKKIYNKDENNIIRFVNKILTNDNNESRDNNLLNEYISKPRDIKLKDLVDEGILCINPSDSSESSDLKNLKDSKNSKRGYTVSVKADGVQKFLVIYNNDFYFVMYKSVEKLNDSKIKIDDEFFNNYKKIEFSIFIGELLEDKRFLPYDCICFNRKNVSKYDYLTRYNYVEKLLKFNKEIKKLTNINIVKKDIFVLGKTSISFYENFKKCCDNHYSYETDGFIFTPIDHEYLCEAQNKNAYMRNLVDYDDVCKYKPINRMSIDFYVDMEFKLMSYNTYNKKYTVFEGSKENRFDYNVNVVYNKFKKEDLKGKIVEYQYYDKDENNNILLEPTRIREDKVIANKIEVATIDWDLINNPIDISTFRGEDVRLMRYYHNDIKREIFSWCEDGYLIDIGGGNGGDIDKWKNSKLKKILSFEPNDVFRNEFETRLKKKNINEDYIKVVEGRGEDSDNIIEECKNFFDKKGKYYISFMISLSFFFDDKDDYEMCKRLGDTINKIRKLYEDVTILFFTIDGYKVEKNIKNGEKKKLNTITLQRENNKIYVDILDSKTVFSQTEYLVKLDRLMSYINYKIIRIKDCNQRELLSENEKFYSNLFSYGMAIFND